MSDTVQLSRYHAVWGDAARALQLRSVCFRDGAGSDADRFDAGSEHLVVVDAARGVALAGCRLRVSSARVAASGYTGQQYDLTDWRGPDTVAELGRVCLHPGAGPDVPRLLWQALTRRITTSRATRLFGCASFAGADVALHADGLAALHHLYRGPSDLRPAALAPAARLDTIVGNPKTGLRDIPQLLRSYLALGGWTGDHAVADHDLDTLHVFVALDVDRIPPARLKRLIGPNASCV